MEIAKEQYAVVVDDLCAKIQFLVDYIHSTIGTTDGGFSFHDGEWWPISEEVSGKNNQHEG